MGQLSLMRILLRKIRSLIGGRIMFHLSINLFFKQFQTTINIQKFRNNLMSQINESRGASVNAQRQLRLLRTL